MLLVRPLRLAGIVQFATAIALTLAADSEPDHSKHNAVQLEESLVKTCDFKIGGHHFKLCPLFEGDWKSRFKQLEWEEQTPPTVTKTVYKMNLAGPLKVDQTLPEHEQCPPGTWVCKTTINTRPDHRSEAPRILSVVPVVGDIEENKNQEEQFGVFAQFGQSWSQRPDDDLPPLWIRMQGGSYVNEPQRALINLRCNDTVEESDPRFSMTFRGTHFFTWTTSHACSHLHKSNSGGRTRPQHPDKPDAPPADIDTPEELLPPDMSLFPSRSTTSIVLSILAAFLLLTYLVLHPPPLLRRLLSPALTPVVRRLRRSRYATFNTIGESKLLRWAQEDLAIPGDDDYTDDMVNGSGGAWFSAGTGAAGRGLDSEEIPLTPSPKKMSFADYGAAGR